MITWQVMSSWYDGLTWDAHHILWSRTSYRRHSKMNALISTCDSHYLQCTQIQVRHASDKGLRLKSCALLTRSVLILNMWKYTLLQLQRGWHSQVPDKYFDTPGKWRKVLHWLPFYSLGTTNGHYFCNCNIWLISVIISWGIK